ncbi:MAG: glycosyltransferase family 4 protein [Geminicoccaceae bacterium]|nr:glycosyltransferase family 4 protein [Geminicoccaceae bacterium]
MTQDTIDRRHRVIAVNRFYAPDYSATAQLLTDLMEQLARDGRRPVVVTSRLDYETTGNPLPIRQVINGVEIQRVWSTSFGRHGLAGRLVDYLTFFASSFLRLVRLSRPGDIILAKTDPPMITVTAALAASLRRARLVAWCQDLFPEVATALGIGRRIPLATSVLKALRNRSLRSAHDVVAIGDGMAARLFREGMKHERIHVIANWSCCDIRPVAHDANPMRHELGLDGRTVIGYSGNLGRVHAPERLAQLVRTTLGHADASWVFFGGGAGMAAIRDIRHRHDDRHLQIHPYQPRSRLAFSLSLADMHLVTLDPTCEGLVLPSKIYGIVAAGRPVLFLGDPGGPTATLIREIGAGIVLPIGDIHQSATMLARCIQGEITLPGPRELRLLHEDRLSAQRALQRWTTLLGVPAATRDMPAVEVAA